MRDSWENIEKGKMMRFYFAAKQGRIKVKDAVTEVNKMVTSMKTEAAREFSKQVLEKLKELENG